jgi:hypothetical protein
MTEADIARMADFLGISRAAFERKYIYRTRNRMRLRVPRAASCHFLKDGGCSIHAAKPAQCRAFPFWPELLGSKREWAKTAHYCPGIGKGSLIQIATAEAQADEMRISFPEQYRHSRA